MGTVEAPAIERAVSLKQNLGERGMIHNVGVSPGLMDKGAATGPYSSEIGGEGRAYVDALVHTNPPKIWEAKFYSWTNFQKTFQSLWISGKKGGHEIQKLLRDGELYAATDDVFNAENRVLYVRADVWKEIHVASVRHAG